MFLLAGRPKAFRTSGGPAALEFLRQRLPSLPLKCPIFPTIRGARRSLIPYTRLPIGGMPFVLDIPFAIIYFVISSSKSMTKDSVKRPGKKGLTPFGIIALLAGIALFAYFVRKAGVGQILEGI